MKSLALALIMIASADVARAALPGIMTYQGRIKETGLPVTGTRSVDIKICPLLTGPAGCVDTGAQGVSVANGLFRTTFTLPAAVAWETGEWYLEVSVGGTPFTPRERFTTVPYAIYASSAATLIPNPGDTGVFIAPSVAIADAGFSVGGSTFVVAGGRVGAGTSSPASTLHVKGTTTLSGEAHIQATGAGASTPAVGNAAGPNCSLATVAGSDAVGRITTGSDGIEGACSLVFGTPWTGNPPVCFFQDETNSIALRASAPSAFSVNFSGFWTNGDVISYICVGY